ncbi:17081_t:CDS:2 [Dentiscutata erythropus]|uniref:Sensitive to high expression protein 9, mitochondrial n=1 Tax=Dentiscutata erythropus TaxID=1348616 RepID=A0A9N9DRJ1_9GLOM|nr:17081_t:CDS:2 [Dentiscutata erythropus]
MYRKPFSCLMKFPLSNSYSTSTDEKTKEQTDFQQTKDASKLHTSILSKVQASTSLSQSKPGAQKPPLLDRISEFIKAVKANSAQDILSVASDNLNKLTGYSMVENLKEKVIQREKEFEVARKRLSASKLAYEEVIAARSATQREINELLQRKHQWSSDDVIKFTQLYKNEHLNEQAETAAREEFQRCEQKVEQEYTELTRSIMLRYHEEQIWSDKIRSASTYGTVALMLLNVILFIGVQTIFEPRKRQKLADKFEELLIQRTNEEESKSEVGIVHTFMKKFENLEGKVDELTQSLTPIFNKLSDYVGDLEPFEPINDNDKLPLTPTELDSLMGDFEKSAERSNRVQKPIQNEIDSHIFISAFLGASIGWLVSYMMTELFR